MKIFKSIKFLVIIIILGMLITNSFADVVKKMDKGFDKNSKNHVIFLIHGLTGDKTTFSDLGKILTKRYKDFGVVVKSLEYPTDKVIQAEIRKKKAGQGLHPFHFAKIINAKIISFLYDHPDLDMNTEYSFIVHSQGGLVTMSYLNSCFNRDVSLMYNRKEFIEKGLKRRCFYWEGVKDLESVGDLVIADEKKRTDIFNPEDPEGSKINLVKDRVAKQAYNTPKNMKMLFTLGSPLWGSTSAINIKKFLPYVVKIQKNKELPGWLKVMLSKGKEKEILEELKDLPLEEIFRLAVAGRGTTWQRALMIDRYKNVFGGRVREENWQEDYKWVSRYPKDLKVYNIAGLTEELFVNKGFFKKGESKLKWALKKFTDPSTYKHDVIVGSSEARLDFIFNLENINPKLPGRKGITNMTTGYFPVDYSHVPIADIQGMANITYDNYKTQKVYAILREAYDKYFKYEDKVIENLVKPSDRIVQNFTSELKFITPRGYERQLHVKLSDVKVKARNYNKIAEGKEKLPNTFYNAGHASNPRGLRILDHYAQSYYHVGQFQRDKAFIFGKTGRPESIIESNPDDHTIDYEIDIMGFETRTRSTTVFPSYTSYTEMYLTPYHPIKNSMIESEGAKLKIRNSFVSVIKAKNEDYRLFTMIKNSKGKDQLHSVYASKKVLGQLEINNIVDRCYVGFPGEPTMRVTRFIKGYTVERNKDFWEKWALNQNKIYAKYNKSIKEAMKGISTTKQMSLGQLLEVIGRYSTGKIDKDSGVSRSCLQREVKKDPNCKGGKDRYLVTSPEIRKDDGIKNFNEITHKLGVRWVNVVDIDIVKKLRVKGIAKESLSVKKEGTCIINKSKRLWHSYLSQKEYKKLYSSEIIEANKKWKFLQLN